MPNSVPSIYFYIPEYETIPPEILKQNFSEVSQWNFQSNAIPDGTLAWVVQTYFAIKAKLSCELTGTFPSQGIVFAHRRNLPYTLKPNPQLLIVCIEADYDRHPYAQLRVLQNRYAVNLTHSNHAAWRLWSDSHLFPHPQRSTFITHWPQVGLLPRDPARGDRVENASFFGIAANLAPELRGNTAWAEELKSIGVNWYFRGQKQLTEQGATQVNAWQDYRDIDVVVAVRSFQAKKYFHKPATKLYNSWLAGVPAILGQESAFQAERRSELDYIEVASKAELMAAILRLQKDHQLYRAMVENGRARAQEVMPEQITNQWLDFIQNLVIPSYGRWNEASEFTRKLFLLRCELREKWERVNQILPRSNSTIS